MATIFAGVYFAIYKPKRLKRSRSAQQWIEDLEAEQVAAGTATTSTSISFKKHDTITK